jgi:hypothetical protein
MTAKEGELKHASHYCNEFTVWTKTVFGLDSRYRQKLLSSA